MNISFTPSVCYRSFTGEQKTLRQKCERPADTFERSRASAPKKEFNNKQIDKFVKFYCSIEDEYSKKALRYCLEDNEERYGDILDKLDEVEGRDRKIKEKKTFTRKFLDLMMLPEFYNDDAIYEVNELTKLPVFDDGNNADVQNILLELAAPLREETETEIADTEENAGEEAEEVSANILLTESIEEDCKPKKLAIFKRAMTLFSAK